MKQIRYILFLLISTLYFLNNGYAQSEAEFIKLVKEYTYKPDGELEFHYNKILKLYTHKAFNNLYGETFIIYNPDFQQLQINDCYTVQADGTTIKAPQNAFNEVLPSAAADAPAFNQIKEMVITHTGLEIGATEYLDYTLKSKRSSLNRLDIDEVLQELSPVKEYIVIVNIPENQEFSYKLTASKIKPEISIKDGMKSYRWKFKNTPAAVNEPYQSVNLYDVPRLTACTYTSTEQALNFFQKYLSAPVDTEIQKFTQQLVQNTTTEKEKVIAIYNYITKNISSIGLSLEDIDFVSRNPLQVLESAYGTKIEKADLLISMLKSVGLKPAFVIVYPETLKNTMKGLKPIQDFFVKVDADHQSYYLSPVLPIAASFEKIVQYKDLWLISQARIEPIPSVTPAEMVLNCNTHIHFTGDSAYLTATINTSGNTMNDLMPVFFNNYKSALTRNFGTLTSSEIIHSHPDQTEIKISAEKNLQKANDYFVYHLPVLSAGITSWQLNVLNTSRKTKMEIPYLLQENYEYTIQLPVNKALKNKNTEIHLKNTAGSVDISLQQKDQTLLIRKHLALTKGIYKPSSAEYGNLRELINLWLSNGTENLILR